MANRWETMEKVIDVLFWGSKITVGGDGSHETKRCLLLGRKAMTNLDSILKSKISRRKEIIKILAEINKKEMKETIVKMNKAKGWFFEKINKIEKLLARLINKKRKKKQINKIINKKERLQQTMQKYKGS